MPLITFDRVTFAYPQAATPVLREVSIRVEAGEVILLRGPSGSGKSTLLRCLNGLVPHSTGGRFQGTVQVCELDTRHHSPRQLGAVTGFVFQRPEAQFVLEDVEAELAFGPENLGLPRTVIRKRLEEVVDQVGIQGLRRRRIDSLSGGERQRVAIAAALAMHPEVIAMDEPTSQLDPQAAEDVLQVVTRLVSELGMTTLIAEHRVERIAPFVDRVWTLAGPGASIEDAPPRTALARGGARPPVVDLAIRARWAEVPIALREARRPAQALRARLGPAPAVAPPPDGRVLVRVEGVRFAYGTTAAVRGATLTLRAGEVCVLMGRNGSGKTTLLKVMAGLLKPTSGRVLPEATVALVPQDADTLLFSNSVREELDGRREDVLPEGIEDWLDRHPRDLSAGERQRIAIVTASAQGKVLLLDEPTRGLDTNAKAAVARTLRRRAASGGAALVATHDVEWAARIADRILLMADGEIYADGHPRSVLSDSLVFSTQINKLLGQGWLLPEEVPIE